MDKLKIKEITEFSDNGANKIKMIFCDADNLEKEIIFQGSGKIKFGVEV